MGSPATTLVMDAIWKRRREAMAVVGIVWLSGFHFFYDGFYHMAAFWLMLAPLALANLDLLRGPYGSRWKGLLAVLLAWQLGCRLIRAGAGVPVVEGLLDVVAVVLLLVAILAVVRVSWGWKACRAGIFGAAVVTSGWALLEFYPMSNVALDDARLRNVLIYPIGLNAVLTGLLVGYAIVAGIDLANPGSKCRCWVLAGLSLLAFALLATQSRGAILSTTVGVAVVCAIRRRRVFPELAALVVGVVGFQICFVLANGGGGGPDLMERGATGRPDIWHAYFGVLEGADWWVGIGDVPPLEESVVGWFVHHPHASWVSQVVWCGIPGLLLLLTFLVLAGTSGWKRLASDPAPLALLAFGTCSLFFDGAQVVSLASSPRIEPLLVLVPAVAALAGVAGPKGRPTERSSDEVGPK